MRLPPRQPARTGGHHRRAADRGWAQRVLPAAHDCALGAVLPVPRRAQRLLAGGAEGVLFPDFGAPHRRIPYAGGLHRDRRGQPRAGQRHHQVEMHANARNWLDWASAHGIHRYVYDYISTRPDQLWSKPPKTEEPFSTPRSWHMLSDAITSYGDNIGMEELRILANGCLTAAHATQFLAYVRQIRGQYSLKRILSGEQRWPDKPEDRDVLYFLAQSLRAQLLRELPQSKGNMSGATGKLALRAKELIAELAAISPEVAQMSITPEDGESLPGWFVVEAVRDIPALAKRRGA